VGEAKEETDMRMMKDGQMVDASEIADLAVDRVDGVDKPATGRSFMLFKSVGRKVAKQVREWLPTGESKPSPVASAMNSWNGATQDGTREPQYASSDNWLTSMGGSGKNTPVGPFYADKWLEGAPAVEKSPNFVAPGTTDVTATAENFIAPTPAGLRLGDSRMVVDLSKASLGQLVEMLKSAHEFNDVELGRAVVKRLGGPAKAAATMGADWPSGPSARREKAEKFGGK
jgi:hypothetical protein